MTLIRSAVAILVVVVATGLSATAVQAQKYGGVLQALLIGNPPSLSMHEETSFFMVFPMAPVFNNLVAFDPDVARESLETVLPDAAERWSWSADGKSVTFALRSGIRWHDGKPLTAADVKRTYDLVRGIGTPKLRLSPRKDWYANVKEVVTNGDREVTFRLGHPQPSLLAMLATGYSAIYPAHIAPPEWRIKATGTGPFVLKEYKRDQYLVLEKNKDYWVRGRPYLDGIRYNIIRVQSSQIAAFQAGQVDVNSPLSTGRPFMVALREVAPHLKFVETPVTVFPAVFANPKVKPWDDRRLWQVLNLALDREAYIKTVFQGGAVMGGANLSPPAGAWGLPKERLLTIPGYAPGANRKEEARKMMASLGYGPNNPLKTKLTVRGDTKFNVDTGVWVAGNLKEVWIEVELRQMETATFFAALARRDFVLGTHSSASAADDPDVAFSEHFSCGSPRNYSDYCVEASQQLYAKQSAMTDHAARLRQVQDIDEKLMRDVARVVLGYMVDYNAMQPYVKNYVPHQTLYSYMRMQDTWLDK
ncbi:MAG: ABC transporter substrate-binding protein [Candidatus Lambdaproteobacteria bacterium]|nr:ABC transporter substrate-binding protein [Candidatus Lambdaproteobacteria bacterium]